MSRSILPLLLVFLLLPLPSLALETSAEQAIIVDLATGDVLLEKNADARMPTSSMSKVMTMFMVFEALRDGRLSLDDRLPVSEEAWRKGGSKMFVLVNDRVRVEDLIRGVIVQSGNDACIVLAEALAGSEAAFADIMTQRAQQLGLTSSNFTNATGWPDPNHYSTARDLARLAALMVARFPEYYHYYAETSFTYADITQQNRNPLVQSGIADGLKTGHTEAAGYGLMASAARDGRRVVMVLNGLPSEAARATESERLMGWALRSFKPYTLFTAGEVVYSAPVWLGEASHVNLVIGQDVRVSLTQPQRFGLDVKVQLEEPVAAPIAAGTALGTVMIAIPERPLQTLPLTAASDVAPLGTLARIQAAGAYLVFGAPAPAP